MLHNLYSSFSSRGNLTVRWTVTQTNKDIAGYYVVVRNLHNRILVEHHLSYEKRNDDIIGSEICNGNCRNLELCVLTKNSHGTINGWFDNQCVYLPSDLERIQNKYDIQSNQIYVIHSLRKQIRAKSVQDQHSERFNSNSSSKAHSTVGDATFSCFLITIFYFLTWL